MADLNSNLALDGAIMFLNLSRQKCIMSLLYVATTVLVSPAFAVAGAFDDASDPAYVDGWQSGDDGGVGFGPWDLAFSGEPAMLSHSPQFIDRQPLPGNSLGAPAFALTTGDRPFFTDTSEARRTLIAPLSVGQTISVDIDGSVLAPQAIAFTIGNTFELHGTDGLERFSLFTNNQ